MLTHFDHVTIVVRDLEKAKQFFGLLGFEHERTVLISGSVFASYMGIPNIEADHVTLVLKDVTPRTEVQLLVYRQPHALPNDHIRELNTLGYNHVCFAVDNLQEILERLGAAGIELQGDVLHFHSRKLVFLRGPEGITLELSERTSPS